MFFAVLNLGYLSFLRLKRLARGVFKLSFCVAIAAWAYLLWTGPVVGQPSDLAKFCALAGIGFTWLCLLSLFWWIVLKGVCWLIGPSNPQELTKLGVKLIDPRMAQYDY